MTNDALDTVGKRAKSVRDEAGKTQKQMAEFLGVATATWQKIERDEGLPSGETLVQFEKLGVNPGWVLSGLGPRRLETAVSNEQLLVFVEILPDIAQAVEEAYRESQARLNQYDQLHEAARWLGELQKLVNNVADRKLLLALLPWVRMEVKREIAAANAGNGKRGASG